MMSSQHTDFEIVAHRGGGDGYAPENTLGGIARTLARNEVEWIDFDVQRSKDGVPVVVHDLRLTRTSNIEEVFPDLVDDEVGDLTLAELKQLDVGSWFAPGDYTGERIPTLSEVLDFIGDRMGITFEMKHPSRYPGIESEVSAVLRHHGLDRSDRLRIGSFELDSIRRMRRELPDARLGAALRRGDELTGSGLIGLIDSISFSPQYTSENLALAASHGLPVHAGTMNGLPRMSESIADGISVICTDYPDVLVNLRNGCAPFAREAEAVLGSVEVLEGTSERQVVLHGASENPVDLTGWYLWTGVKTPLHGVLAPGESISVKTLPLRAKNVSSVQVVALHDDQNTLIDLREFWAVPRHS